MYNKNIVTTLVAFCACMMMEQSYGMHLRKQVTRKSCFKQSHLPRATRHFLATDSKILTVKPEELVRDYFCTVRKLSITMGKDPSLEAFYLLKKKIDFEYAKRVRKLQHRFKKNAENYDILRSDPCSSLNLLSAKLEMRQWNESLHVTRLEAQHTEKTYGPIKSELKKMEETGVEIGLFSHQETYQPVAFSFGTYASHHAVTALFCDILEKEALWEL